MTTRSAPGPAGLDRAGAVRAAMRRTVARHGFHGASMASVAREAGVATGTAYVHYASKDELVLATYVEVKRDLGEAAVSGVDAAAPARERFERLWRGAYEHLRSDPDRARFLLQVENSPYAQAAHERAVAQADEPLSLAAQTPDLAAALVSLPPRVLYDLALGPAVRLAAAGLVLEPQELRVLVEACWRAVTR